MQVEERAESNMREDPAPGGDDRKDPDGARVGHVPVRRAALLIVAHARRGQDDARRAYRLLARRGVPIARFALLRDAGRLAEVAQAALDDGCDLVIVGGGDGSLSAVAGLLADRRVPLGIVPLGTANDFARTLHIPAELEAACALIAERPALATVDLGRHDDASFLNVTTIGLGGRVARSQSNRLKRWLGSLAYPLTVARVLLGYRPFDARLTFPEGDHPATTLRRLLQVAVGNGRYYAGGSVVAPSASLRDGALDVYAIQIGGWRDLLGVALTFRSGRMIQRSNVAYYRTRTVRIETSRRAALDVDGEAQGWTPVTFSVARRALRVIAPDEMAD